MTKKKLLIFSDCFTYSGSENVIENILLSRRIKSQFDIHFLYGFNKSYENRFKERAALLGINLNISSSVSLLSPEWSIYQYNLLKGISLKKLTLFIRVIFLKLLKMFFVSHVINFFLLKSKFRQLNPDLIYINNGGYPASLQCCLGIFVARSMNVNNIYFNINNMAVPRIKFYEKYLDNYINRSVTRFITASFAAQEHLINTRTFDSNKFSRIPNTIFNDKELSEMYSETQKTAEIVTFGSIGLLTERKGYHVLLKAVEILVYEYKITNIKINIIGDGEDKSMLFDKSKLYEIGQYVNFLGFKSNPLTELTKFDVFILPSLRNEDFPYVILEAMLLSKPIIGTKVAGIPEQIDENMTGFIVEPNDALALAKAMMKFLKERDKIISMGLTSGAKYASEFNYSRVEEMYFTLLTSSN